MCVKFGFVGANRSYAFLVHSFGYALFYFRENKRQRGNVIELKKRGQQHILTDYIKKLQRSIRKGCHKTAFFAYPYFSVKTIPKIIIAPPKYCATLIASFKIHAPSIIVVTGSSADIIPAVAAPSYLTPA